MRIYFGTLTVSDSVHLWRAKCAVLVPVGQCPGSGERFWRDLLGQILVVNRLDVEKIKDLSLGVSTLPPRQRAYLRSTINQLAGQ
jgi:hypothetical protein